MSDLISRSRVISVLEQLEEHSLTGKMHISNAIYLLENQPTAYDIDKVVEELEKIRAKETCNKEKCDTKEICRICVVDDAIEIVQEVAEEYTSTENINCSTDTSTYGWIACSEKLPELETEVLICTKNRGMTIASLTKPDIFWEDEEGDKLIGVIAWQPLPEPYKE